jgi:protease I
MKILFFLAPKDFRDEEYFIPYSIFTKKGFKTFTTSTKKGLAIGVYGGEAKIDFSYEEIKIKDYDAVIFVGGKGSIRYLNNKEVHQIIRNIDAKNVLAAICIAPLILLDAGVLIGKKVTVWSSSLDKSSIDLLKKGGAIYEEKNVVCDGNVITANGPNSAEEFALKIVENLTKNNI